jgi:4-amino-4-deoxychorismate lyase
MKRKDLSFIIKGDQVMLMKPEEHLLSDRGLAYGHGVFETILRMDHEFPLLDKHLTRMVSGAAAIGIQVSELNLTLAIKNFEELVKSDEFECGVVKIILTAGRGGRGYKSPTIVYPHLIFRCSELDENWGLQRNNGIHLWSCRQQLSRNKATAGIKHLNRLDQVIASDEVYKVGYKDGLMFDTEGQLIETTCANIFIRSREHGWVTPVIESAGINGVMRSFLIEDIFPFKSLSLNISWIDAEKIQAADEMFICNSIRGIVPITCIINGSDEDSKLMDIGETTRELQSMLSKLHPCFK